MRVVFVNKGFQIVSELSDSTALRQLQVGQTELFRLKVNLYNNTHHIYTPQNTIPGAYRIQLIKPHLYVHNECFSSLTWALKGAITFPAVEIIKYMLPLQTIEKEGFQSLVHVLDPRYELRVKSTSQGMHYQLPIARQEQHSWLQF